MFMLALRSKLLVLALLPTIVSAPTGAAETETKTETETETSSITLAAPQVPSATKGRNSSPPANVARRARGNGPLTRRPALRLCTYLGCPGVTVGGIGF